MSARGAIAPLVGAAVAAAIWMPSAPRTAPPSTAQAVVSVAAEGGGPAAFRDGLAERPLFDSSRRPPRAAAAEATPMAPAAAPETRLSLVGIIEDGGARIALVRMSGRSELLRVGKGDSAADWRVLDVELGHITVARDGGDPELLPLGR